MKTSPEALAAAKEIQQKLGGFQEEGRKYTYELCAGDEFGPSLGDHRDGEQLVTDRIAELIERHMRPAKK